MSDRDLHLDVWQFVRLMVQMEESVKAGQGGAALKRLYDLWEDLWVDLDAQLVDLGQRDRDGFADLMMEQEVVLEAVPPGARTLVAAELDKVVRSLKRELSACDDPAQVEDLSFERDELALVIRSLRGAPQAAGDALRTGPGAGSGKGPGKGSGKGPGKGPGPNRPGPKKSASPKRPAGGGPPRRRRGPRDAPRDAPRDESG